MVNVHSDFLFGVRASYFQLLWQYNGNIIIYCDIYTVSCFFTDKYLMKINNELNISDILKTWRK